MKRNRIHILIVDDEATQGKALMEAFNRKGYTAIWVNSSVNAVTAAQRQEFHALIIDCLLPKMNGIDLAEELVQLSVRKPKLILYSGIYKDKGFIREATAKTGCVAFLTKPLQLDEVISHIEHALADELKAHEDPAVIKLYSKETPPQDQILRMIIDEPTLHGFHLPALLKCMQKTSLSGELTLINNAGDVNSIMFFDGRIFSVRTPDKDSYFGAIAVNFGLVASEDVLEALNDRSRKLLGQKLIDSMALSPHAINLIMEEQLALRLSQCVHNEIFNLQWIPHKFAKPDYTINLTRFDSLMDDWISSKMDFDWLRAQFGSWGNYRIEGQFHHLIQDPLTLEELLSHEDFKEIDDLAPLMGHILHKEAYLGTRNDQQEDYRFLDSRLQIMLKNFKEQNYFQILGVGEKAHAQEVNRAFQDLKTAFDPERLPKDIPAEVYARCTEVFETLEKAHATLSDDISRSRYQNHLQGQRSQSLLENEPIFRAAILELQSGHAQEAAKKFQSLIDRKLEFRDLRSYRIWAGFKVDRTFSAMKLDQVPPEERHSPVYMMAKGLSHRSRGQFSQALQAFKTAHVLDPRLGISRLEVKDMLHQLEKSRAARDLIREVASVLESLSSKRSA